MQPSSAVRSNSFEKTVTFSKAVEPSTTGPKRRMHANLTVCAEQWNLLSNNSELHADCTIYDRGAGRLGAHLTIDVNGNLSRFDSNLPLKEYSISIHITSSLLITRHIILIHQITSPPYVSSHRINK